MRRDATHGRMSTSYRERGTSHSERIASHRGGASVIEGEPLDFGLRRWVGHYLAGLLPCHELYKIN